MNPAPTRRDFIKKSTVLAASAGLFNISRAQSSGMTLKVALVGCGGRGAGNRGALANFIEAAGLLGHQVEIMAVADIFAAKAAAAAEQFSVPANRVMVGAQAYQRVMETAAEYVILATPPNFRPLHLAAAVAANKHVFIEKPIAIDPPGVRAVMRLGEEGRAKGLSLVAGTQRRHSLNYLTNQAQVEAGAIGEILGGVVMWNGTVPFLAPRQPGQSNRDYLLRNWINFVEMSGDHIVEQHMHNLDVANWFIGRTPIAAVGMGGRARRVTGNQYDFFSVDYDYGDGVHINSQCRQLAGAYGRIGESFRGTHGEVLGGGKLTGRDVSIPEINVLSEDGMIQEHVDLIAGVLNDTPENRVLGVAESTMTALMGRISAYTGDLVRWRDLMDNENSPYYNLTHTPAAADFTDDQDVPMPEEEIPVPGDGGEVYIRS
jgi:myo-inositol 2-dehydrogenase / D-chiro-inositol 1-dehydrogenase